ncbi:MAG: MBOAT family O-acyltransferase [Erysipelothrix sp.]
MIFYFLVSSWLIFVIIITTFIIYASGLILDFITKKSLSKQELEPEIATVERQQSQFKKKRVIKWSIILIIGILIILKYAPFITSTLNTVLAYLPLQMKVPILKFMIPLGISFYSLQAISYCVDVYRGVVSAERNYFKLLLFLSFFPTIMQGPIARYSDVKDTLFAGKSISADSFVHGSQRIVWGLFKKIMIADRLNSLVIAIIDGENAEFVGSVMLLGAAIYTIQLYMDFSGIVDISLGTAEIFNIKLPENFRQPFFAKTVTDFWKRWHITLGAWLKDYVFYPVMLSRRVKSLTKKSRKKFGKHASLVITNAVALFVVWLCNGFWHGSGWNYVMYGMYYFTLITLALVFEPFFEKLKTRLHLDKHKVLLRLIQIMKMAFLIVIGELIFRVESVSKIFIIFKNILFNFNIAELTTDLFSRFKFDISDGWVVIMAILLVFIFDLLKEYNINLLEKLNYWPIWARWSLSYVFIVIIIVFGAYGRGYTPVDIIYAGF